MKTVLITGFGPFPGVPDNPTATLARAVHGRRIGSVRFVGDVLPVSYRRAPEQTLALIDAHKADHVVGTGVSRHVSSPVVESVARWVSESTVDVEGQTRTLLEGPPQRASSWAPAVAEGLGAPLSRDAGRYVCNAWLYRVLGTHHGPRAAFVHMPPAPIDADAFCQGIARALA